MVAGSVLLFYNKTEFAGSAAWLCISVLISATNGKKSFFVSQIIITGNLASGVLSKSRLKASSFTFVNQKFGNLLLIQIPSYYVFKKASQRIGVIMRLRNLIPTEAKLQLFKAAILLHLTYCYLVMAFL